MPHIVKCFDLRLDGESAVSEDSVVFLIGVERRIKTDKVNASGGEIRHDVQTVTIVKCVRLESDVHIDFSRHQSIYPPTKVGG